MPGSLSVVKGPSFKFSGNPYASISEIDVTGGITCSRTSGNTPCFIQVSGSAITATGTSVPFEDLDFRWDFGDPSGTENFVIPGGGCVVNANNWQQGPEAAYCYRSAGTFTVTLTVTAKVASGSYISAQTTQNITVSDFSASGGDWYFDSGATGTNDGTSQANAFTLMTGGSADMTNLVAKLNTTGAALHFKKGSAWTVTSITPGMSFSFGGLGYFYFNKSSLRVDTYGSGSNPQFITQNVNVTFTGSIGNGSGGSGTVLNVTAIPSATKIPVGSYIADTPGNITQPTKVTDNSSANADGTGNYTVSRSLNVASQAMRIAVLIPIVSDNGGGASPASKTDIVMSDIDFVNAGGTTSGFMFFNFGSQASANCSNLYFDNCNFTSNTTTSGDINHVIIQRNQNVGATADLDNIGFWGGSVVAASGDGSKGIAILVSMYDFLFIVGMMINGAGSDNTRDHHIYPDVQNHALFKWINFGDGPTRNFCINGNWDDDTGLAGEESHYWLISQNNMTGTLRAFDASNNVSHVSTTQFYDFVVEGNSIHDLTGDGCVVFSCCKSVTFRNNNVWSNNAGRFWGPDGSQLKTLLTARLYGNKFYRDGGSANGGVVDYNLTGWTAAQFIKNNIIYDNATTAKCVALFESDQVSASSTIDGNNYYAPNDSDSKPLLDNATAKSLATWQSGGLDAATTSSNPVWISPSTGSF